MKILVNARSLFGSGHARQQIQTLLWLQQVALQHPAWQFTVVTDVPLMIPAGAFETIVQKPLRINRLHLQWWYRYQLPALAEKLRVAGIIHLDAVVCPVKKIRQLALISESQWLLHPSKPNATAYRKFKSGIPFKPTWVNLVNIPAEDLQRLHIDEANFKCLTPAPDAIYQPLGFEAKEAIKAQYTAGKEYFFFNGPYQQADELLPLFKAFSLFKKRQKSNMPLVVALHKGILPNALNALLQQYKYKDDVLVLSNLSDNNVAQLTAASYAALYPVTNTQFYTPILAAMAGAVPVITSTNTPWKAPQAGIVLTADPTPESLAEAMMQLFKNETARAHQIQLASTWLAQASLTDAATALAQLLQGSFNP